jgi:hypothetical protein
VGCGPCGGLILLLLLLWVGVGRHLIIGAEVDREGGIVHVWVLGEMALHAIHWC